MNNDLVLNIANFTEYIVNILVDNVSTYKIYDIPDEMYTLYCDVFGHEHKYFEMSNITLLNDIQIIFDLFSDSKNNLSIGIYLTQPDFYNEKASISYLDNLNLLIKGYESGHYEGDDEKYKKGRYDYSGEYHHEDDGENSIVNQKCCLKKRYIKIIPFGLYKSMELNWNAVRKFLRVKQGKNICKKCFGKIIL